MRVLVDTSVWADLFNEQPTPEAALLTRLIEDEADLVTCGLVVAEFFQGIRRTSTLPELERHFLDMDWLSPAEPDTYLKAAALFRALRADGLTRSVSMSDSDLLSEKVPEAYGRVATKYRSALRELAK